MLLFGGVILYLAWPVLGDPEPRFQARHGELMAARITQHWQADGAHYEDVELRASSGLRVRINVRRPGGEAAGRYPVVLLLGGVRTGRRATGLIDTPYPVVIAALDYPYRGDPRPRGLALVPNIRHVQQALMDTTPAVMLTLDYLLQRADVDPRRVELVGVSLGAFLAATPAALDARVTRLWLVQGAGDPARIFATYLEDDITSPWWRRRIARAAAFLANAHHLAPERWVGRVAPRPVIVINSRDDPSFPAAAVSVLHRALGEPSEIIWVPGTHVAPTRKEVLDRLSRLVLERIVATPDPRPGGEGSGLLRGGVEESVGIGGGSQVP